MGAIRQYVRLTIAVLGCAAAAYSGSVLRATGRQSGDEQLIRDARARSNQAIAAHDLAAIARVWMEDVHVASSTSAQTAAASSIGSAWPAGAAVSSAGPELHPWLSRP